MYTATVRGVSRRTSLVVAFALVATLALSVPVSAAASTPAHHPVVTHAVRAGVSPQISQGGCAYAGPVWIWYKPGPFVSCNAFSGSGVADVDLQGAYSIATGWYSGWIYYIDPTQPWRGKQNFPFMSGAAFDFPSINIIQISIK
jgi:hypothetical protein